MDELDNPNKQILYVDHHYKKLILYVCYRVLSKHPGIPLEAEDIYYQFLYQIPNIFAKYDFKRGNLKTFILLSARGFAQNQCRFWNKRKHQVMNFFAPMEFEIADVKKTILIEDLQIIKTIKALSPLEQKVFEYYFFDGKSCHKIAKLLNQSYHLIAKQIKNLESKMKFLLIEE